MQASQFFSDAKVAALAKAAAEGDVAEVERLVAEGVDPNTVGKEDMSPLWFAFAAHNTKGMKALLDAGADPDYIPPGMGGTMLELALMGDKPFTVELARVLLEGGADVNRLSRREEPVIMTALLGAPRLEKVQLVAAHGGDVNATTPCGESLLEAAVGLRAFDVAKWLIEQGADVHHVDKDGGTAAWQIQHDLDNDLYADWARKEALEVKAIMEAKGVKFPPDPPYAWREVKPPEWEPCW
jgi:ankyrin repeat protein